MGKTPSVKIIDLLSYTRPDKVSTKGYGQLCEQCNFPITESIWVRKFKFRIGRVRNLNQNRPPGVKYYHLSCAKQIHLVE